MIGLPTLLDINAVFFTFLGYPMSYIEFFGTIANLLSVWLVSKRNILNWPVGIVGVILFMILFFQINLYSDLLEQIYFLITGFIGWWAWYKGKDFSKKNEDTIQVVSSSQKENIVWIFYTLLLTVVLWVLAIKIPVILPNIFVEPPSFPWLDAFTTAMSFIATYLMIKKRISCWYYWIFVDVIGIGLYHAKDVKFLSVLYAIFLILAVRGLFAWKKSVQIQPVMSSA